MQRIILYIVLVGVVFWGFNSLRSTWESNQKSLDATYSDVTGSLLNWYKDATDSTKDLKDKLNTTLQESNDKYLQLKSDIESANAKIEEKKNQLDNTLKQMEEAKKALDQLLERDKAQQQATSTPPSSAASTLP